MSERNFTLTQERLKELFHYDETTGLFSRRIRTSNRVKVGDVAKTKGPSGYVLIGIEGVRQYAHRLAWLYMTGEWPIRVIDHINGMRDDNRFCNLRDVTQSRNSSNRQGPSTNNRSGFLGVGKRSHGKFNAQIKLHGEYAYLGTFDTPEKAHAAYLAAKTKFFVD